MASDYNGYTSQECKDKGICYHCEVEVNVEKDYICGNCFSRLWRKGHDPYGLGESTDRLVDFNVPSCQKIIETLKSIILELESFAPHTLIQDDKRNIALSINSIIKIINARETIIKNKSEKELQ